MKQSHGKMGSGCPFTVCVRKTFQRTQTNTKDKTNEIFVSHKKDGSKVKQFYDYLVFINSKGEITSEMSFFGQLLNKAREKRSLPRQFS